MELTLDQALQHGIAAHKAGKHQVAERLYRAILNAQPDHPDANHNLGVLAVAFGKHSEALPFFIKALQANSVTEQFWLSYVHTLIELERLSEAEQALQDGINAGVSIERLSVFSERLQRQFSGAKNSPREASKLRKHAKKKLGAKKNKRGVQRRRLLEETPQSKINELMEHYHASRFDDARKLAEAMTQEFPDYQFGWKVLAVVLRQKFGANESLAAMEKCVQLAPADAEAHNNLGATYRQLGRLNESEASIRQAIALKPDFAEAYNNLGNVLRDLERPADALVSYAHAVYLNSDLPDAKLSLGSVLKGVRFRSQKSSLYPPLISLLTTGYFVRPRDACRSIISLLKRDPLVEELIVGEHRIDKLSDVKKIIYSLDKLPLLHQLMRISPIPDLELERIFVAMRRVLLTELDKVDTSATVTNFLSTLAIHCFTNEYVYFESHEEGRLVKKLEARISELAAASKKPSSTEILCLACYRPIHHYNWSEKLNFTDRLGDIKKRLLDEPLVEKTIIRDLSSLGEISHGVSRRVRDQYEHNPYPRWVTLALPLKSISISELRDQAELQIRLEAMTQVSSPEILVAGCGTGEHSIVTAKRFSDCNVIAVDLSLSSLGYAARKSQEIGIANVEHMCADILSLDELNRKFDIIESVGVLHHMCDPLEGWRALTRLLKPGGLMKIGLYSELARQHIAAIREEIATLEIDGSVSVIRGFRHTLVESKKAHHKRLVSSIDFFSLSDFRDLIFHVEEHRFTLPQVDECLGKLGLQFCGFEDGRFISKFREYFGSDADIYDLALWSQFEDNNPRTFAGMYQFWCQKL